MAGASDGVPESASEHPATWTFDHPIYHPPHRAAWRAWLELNHGSVRGAWVATWRKESGRDGFPYVEVVEEALCFGGSTRRSTSSTRTGGCSSSPLAGRRAPGRA